jgi:hypothetical protein
MEKGIKVSGLEIRSMALVNTSGRMAVSIKAIIQMVREMAREKWSTKMESNIKVNGFKVKNMEKAYIAQALISLLDSGAGVS